MAAVILALAGKGWAQGSGAERNGSGGTAFVPMDSYVYSLFDRLASEGIVDSQFAGMRPWTREQCARLVLEGEKRIDNGGSKLDREMMEWLRKEFARELEKDRGARIHLEEVYVRSLSIGGRPLTDYHFGQTIYNDNGRPYAEGESVAAGFAATEAWKAFVFHVQGELQHTPAPPVFSTAEVDFLNAVDELPAGTSHAVSGADRFRFIELYGGVHLKNTNLTIGKQTLWWGPSPDSAMLLSTNAEPLYMLRLQQDGPKRLPWMFRFLGPMRWDSFFGKLDGHRFPADPYLHGQKISFKPARGLEVGFSRTVQFAGAGHGLTFGNFWKSFTSVGDDLSMTPGSAQDVGDRRGGLDVSYRVPGVRQGLTVYSELFTEDDPSPLSAPARSGLLAGLYLALVPGSKRADLRVEVLTTDRDSTKNESGKFFYFNRGYKDGYTNGGKMLASWIGRDATGFMASSQYWLSATRKLSVSYRNVKSNAEYLPGGGTQHDGRISFQGELTRLTWAEGFAQFEQWRIPVLARRTERNLAIGVKLSYRPK